MTDVPDSAPEAHEPAAPASTPTLLDRLGPRAVRRMSPRLGVAVAGAGALIAVGGAVGIGADQLVGEQGDVQRVPGILIAAALIAAGHLVLARVRTGPFATAGATAAALGVPVLLFFLTFDAGTFPPFSLDAILAVSPVAWLAAYLVGPATGRVVLLGLALAGSWLFVLNLLEPIENLTPFGMLSGGWSSYESSAMSGSIRAETDVFASEIPDFSEIPAIPEPTEGPDVGFVPPPGAPELVVPEPPSMPSMPSMPQLAPTPELPAMPGPQIMLDEEGFGFEPPDFTDVAVVSLLFGVAYAVAALVLSWRGRHGAGTPFSAVGLVALVVGVALIAPDLEQVGTGVLAIVLGLGLAASGATSGRRVTAWAGAAGVGFGVIAVMQEGVQDSDATAQSLAFLFVGIAVVFAGQLLATRLGEPEEEDPAPSALRAGHQARPSHDDPLAVS